MHIVSSNVTAVILRTYTYILISSLKHNYGALKETLFNDDH